MIAIWANVSTNRRKWLTTDVFGSLFLVFGGFLFMDQNLALELFGYLGTALVLLSFIMTNIKWLRVVNMAGGIISLIYALCINTMPVVVLNASVTVINAFQLIRIIVNEKNAAVSNLENDGAYIQIDKVKEEQI